ncbi:MAG: UDP-4-amino-4,6-dideoxy-N-acetyl-beta-L-altrosamine transaminase [Anaerovoracaceae bacterium]
MRKIPYGKQTVTDDDIAAVTEVLRSPFLTTGPKIGEFEQAVAAYHKAKYAVAFSSGTAALHGAYSALEPAPGSELLTSPITFAATANAGVYCGMTPRFVDIDPATNCLDLDALETCLTDRTTVIAPVSFGGYPVDLRRVREIADRHGCAVVHDAAHAIGSRRGGTFGMEYVDMAILSFHPVKHVTAAEGGMVLTNREDLRQKLRLFRVHGITKDPARLTRHDGPWYYEMQSLGYNYRLSDVHAALGLSQFRRLDENLLERNEIADRYSRELGGLSFLTLPPSVGTEILAAREARQTRDLHAWHLYTLTVRDPAERPRLYRYLHERGILAQIHYIPVPLQPYYRQRYGYRDGDFPRAEEFYAREISLPMYHNMAADDLERIISTLKNYADQQMRKGERQ